MPENVDRPVVPEFSPETMGKNILSFQTPDKAAELAEYCFQHLDSSNDEGKANAIAFRERFESIEDFITAPEATDGDRGKKIQNLIREVCSWTATDGEYLVQSEAQRLKFMENWKSLHEVLQRPSLTGLDPNLIRFIGDFDLSEEDYWGIFPKPILLNFEAEEGKKKAEEPETAPERKLSEFNSAMSALMSASPDKHSELLELILKDLTVEDLKRWFSVIYYGGTREALVEMRGEPSEERRTALLSLLGFSSKPSAKAYFVRMRVVSSLLDKVSDSPSKNALMRVLTKALGLLHPDVMGEEDANAVLSGAESIGSGQFDAYFGPASSADSSESSEKTSMGLNRLRNEIARIMVLPAVNRTIELRQLMEGMDAETLKSLLSPLLSTTMANAVEHRRTPGNVNVRNVILALCGFDSPPEPKLMFKRLLDLQDMLGNVLRMPDLSSVKGTKEAFKRGFNSRTIPSVDVYNQAIPLALMHLVPDELVSDLVSGDWGPEWLQRWTSGEGHVKGSLLRETDQRATTRAMQAHSAVEAWTGNPEGYWGQVGKDFLSTSAAMSALVGGALEGGARASAEMARRATAKLGPSTGRNILLNKVRTNKNFDQYEAFFSRSSASSESSESESSPTEKRTVSGTLDRASDAIDKLAGREVPSWAKKLGLVIGVAAGAEWAIRGAGTLISTGWGLTKKAGRTTLNVAAAPFSGMANYGKSMWNKGWGAIKPAEQNEIPENSPWYKRLGNSTWYRTRQFTRGVSAFALGGSLALAGATYGGAVGTAAMATEAIGIRYNNDVAEGPEITVDAVVKAVDGKMSEDAVRELAEIEDPGEAVQKVMAELGEGGQALLEGAGLMTSGGPKAFGDRFSTVQNAGMVSMMSEAFGGAKELAIDNTVKAVKLTGSRKLVEGTAGLVLGNFKIPNLNELATLKTMAEKVGPKLFDNYQGIINDSSRPDDKGGFINFLEAAGRLSDEDLKGGLNEVINAFDLAEGGGLRAAGFGMAPFAASQAANWYLPSRKFKPSFGRGLGKYLASLDQAGKKQMSAFVGHPEVLDKMQSEHSLLSMKTEAELDAMIVKYKEHAISNIIKGPLFKFIGISAISEKSAEIYIKQIEPAVAKLESIKGADGKITPMADLVLNSVKNALYLLRRKDVIRVINGGQLKAAS